MLESLLEKLFQWLSERRQAPVELPIEPPVEYKSVSIQTILGSELYNLLGNKFPGIPIYQSDSLYRLCHPDDIAYFLAQDSTNRMEYIAEKQDCDDFARRLYGQFAIPDWSDLTFGLVWTDLHAMNIMVDVDKNVWFVEPQNDDIQSELKEWQGQSLRFILM